MEASSTCFVVALRARLAEASIVVRSQPELAMGRGARALSDSRTTRSFFPASGTRQVDGCAALPAEADSMSAIGRLQVAAF